MNESIKIAKSSLQATESGILLGEARRSERKASKDNILRGVVLHSGRLHSPKSPGFRVFGINNLQSSSSNQVEPSTGRK